MVETSKNVEGFREDLLLWYDRHRRVLPWRAMPGQIPDPYHVWLSEIMLQQTTVQAVIPYYLKFLEKWPTVHDLANTDAGDVMQAWAGLGYYARARNLHKCAKHVSERLGGAFPATIDALKALPGVGDYTSAAISAIAFNQPANVVDGNVERVMARIYAVTDPLPLSKPILKKLAAMTADGETKRPGDYAQALMDLGATICTPTSPKCMICPVREYCSAYEKGIAASLPMKSPKALKPQKHGYVYWVTDEEGRILFERRSEKGMLGGTIGLPTSSWLDATSDRLHEDMFKESATSEVRIRHGFTHFDLELHGAVLENVRDIALNDGYFWLEREKAVELGLPTLFKKAFRQFLK